MAVKILEWKLAPGKHLPDPVIQDDRESFPPEIVRRILEWLEQTKHTFQTDKPRGQTLILQNDAEPLIRFGDKADRAPDEKIAGYGAYDFDHGSIELLFRHTKSKLLLAKYYYVVARTPDGKMIVGPQVNIVQVAQLQ